MKQTVVSNTSPMITLFETLPDGELFTRKLFDKILIPEEVIKELIFKTSLTSENYLKRYKIDDLIEVKLIAYDSTIPGIDTLDAGEAFAISLALRENFTLIIDENKGRKVASAVGLNIEYSSEQIVKANRKQLIEKVEAENKLKLLFDTKRIGENLYKRLLTELDKV